MTYEECRLQLEKILDRKIIMETIGEEVIYSFEVNADTTKNDGWYITPDNEMIVGSVLNDDLYCLDTMYTFTVDLETDKKKNVILALFELAKTPLDEREKKDKYYLRHKYLNDDVGSFGYLNIVLNKGYYVLDNNLEMQGYSVKFTLNDIEKLKKKLNTDLSEFDIVKVEN